MFSFAKARAALLSLLLMLAPASVWAQDAVPLSVYGSLPEVEDAAISPSGENIAVLLTRQGVRQLYFINSQMQVFNRMAVGDAKIRYFQWVGDRDLLLVNSQTEDLWGFTTDKIEVSSAQLIPMDADREVQLIFSDDRSLPDAIFGNYGVRKVGDRWAMYFGAIEFKRVKTGSNLSSYRFNHGRPYLYTVDAHTNKSRRVELAARDGYDRDWIVDARGQVAARLDISSQDGDWTIVNADDVTIAQGNERNGRMGLIGLGYDGTSLIYSERDEENFSLWWEVALAGGEAKPFLHGVDVDRLYFDHSTGHLMGYLDAQDGPVFGDRAMQSAAKGIQKAFKDFDMRMIDWTPDLKKVLVRTSGNGDSGSWFVVDLSNGEANAFAYERDVIGPQQVGPISTFEYTAQDGLEMDGILTLPPGREAKSLPVVMLPHGGPHSYDRAEFDWWAQAYASRGYAVFQPNFRGSTNRSQQFKLAGYGEWGRKMQTDISDGLAALAEKGIVDPSRACIVGASYGGYAALAGVTIQQGLYKCAVGVAPVSDLRAMYNEDYRASGRERITKRSLLDQLGSKDSWDDVSPRRLAERADAPIMLIHGEDDTVVPYSHSSQMADKLKDHGKPHEPIKLEAEDHWLSLSQTRMQMLEAAVGFVEKHNPAD